jgi:hypothetical protein
MKQLIFLFTLCLTFVITSCGGNTTEKSKTSEPVFNSEQGYVQIDKFDIDSLSFMNSVKELKSEDKIHSLVYMTCLFAEDNCQNELTFKPMDAFITKLGGDTILVNLTFEAQNSYGVPGKLSAYVPYVKDTPILESAFVSEN